MRIGLFLILPQKVQGIAKNNKVHMTYLKAGLLKLEGGNANCIGK